MAIVATIGWKVQDRPVAINGSQEMDPEDLLSKRPQSPLALLLREDLDRLSVEELGERIRLLEEEIARSRAKRDSATAFRSAADSLFRK